LALLLSKDFPFIKVVLRGAVADNLGLETKAIGRKHARGSVMKHIF
jgi:hypothetical protein